MHGNPYDEHLVLRPKNSKKKSVFIWNYKIKKISNAPKVRKQSCEHMDGQCL